MASGFAAVVLALAVQAPAGQADTQLQQLRALGPIQEGTRVTPEWTVKGIRGGPNDAQITLVNAQGKSAMVDIGLARDSDPPEKRLGQAGSDGIRISFRNLEVAPPAFEPVGRALVKQIRGAAGPDFRAAITRWLGEGLPPAGALGTGAGSFQVAERLGPFAKGEALADGWSIETITVQAKGASIHAKRGTDDVVFDLSAEEQPRKGLYDVAGVHVFYRSTKLPPSAYQEAGRAISKRIETAAAGKAGRPLLETWIAAATPPRKP